jgi:hypothetical protein
MSPAEIKRGEKSGLLMRAGRKPKPIYRDENVLMGVLRGLGFWQTDHFPGATIASLEQRLRGCVSRLRDGDLSHHEYGLFFRNLGDLLEELRRQIERLNDLPQAFDPQNLIVLAAWANSIGPHRYDTEMFEIRRLDLDGQIVTFEQGKSGFYLASVGMPKGFEPVSPAFIDEFILAIAPRCFSRVRLPSSRELSV